MTWTVATIVSPNSAAVGAWLITTTTTAGAGTATTSFTITVNCVLSTFSVTSGPADTDYVLDAAAITTAAIVTQ